MNRLLSIAILILVIIILLSRVSSEKNPIPGELWISTHGGKTVEYRPTYTVISIDDDSVRFKNNSIYGAIWSCDIRSFKYNHNKVEAK